MRAGEDSPNQERRPTATTASGSQHSAGPWQLSDVREFGRRKVEAWTREPNGHQWRKRIAEMLDNNMDDGESDANARLIAAAPDLLAALKHALTHIDDYFRNFHPITIRKWEAAIAKAEGATHDH